MGANDGAVGTAAVLELARVLGRSRPARAPRLRFVLFDGEEAPAGCAGTFLDCGDRGSKAYVAAHGDEMQAMILLDFIGNKGLVIPREATSSPALWARLRAAAKRVGVGRVFPHRTTGGIQDDHTPFLQRGIPAIDLIDFDYACFHRTCDRLDQLSARSVDAVGETVVELVRAL